MSALLRRYGFYVTYSFFALVLFKTFLKYGSSIFLIPNSPFVWERLGGIVLGLAFHGALFYLVSRVKLKYFRGVSTVALLFVFYGALLGATFLYSFVFQGGEPWLLRLGVLILGIGAFAKNNSSKPVVISMAEEKDIPWHLLKWTAVFLLTLILWNSVLYILTRGGVVGDEQAWWYSAAEMISKKGFYATLQEHTHSYRPFVPFLASLPTQVLGSWAFWSLWAYPLLIPILMVLYAHENRKSNFFYHAALSLFIFLAITNDWVRRLFWQIFYGESLAGLAFLLIMVEVPRFWQKGFSRDKKTMLFLGTLFASAAVTKPALSYLVLGYVLVAAVFLGRRDGNWKWPLFLVLASQLFSKLWLWLLAFMGRQPHYRPRLEELIDFQWPPVINVITYGVSWYKHLILVSFFMTFLLLLVFFRKKFGEVLWPLFVSYSNLASILFLYATFFSHVEFESSIRYVSQSFVVLPLVLATLKHSSFSKDGSSASP